MAPGGEPPAGTDPAAGPDAELRAASAMVFVDDPAVPILTQGDVHHLIDVLRLRPGEPVVASDGAGAWCRCRLAPTTAGRSGHQLDPATVLLPDGARRTEPPADPPITVAFAPIKGERPEWIVEKLTELGVDRIVPVHTARSVVRWDGARGERAVAKLRRVTRQAAAQCRRTRLPVVEPVTTLEGLAGLVGTVPALVRPGGRRPGLDRTVVAVGPEGGWDPAEEDRFGPGIGLGPTVLRAETAAVTVGTLLCALRTGLVQPLA